MTSVLHVDGLLVACLLVLCFPGNIRKSTYLGHSCFWTIMVDSSMLVWLGFIGKEKRLTVAIKRLSFLKQ